MHILGAQGARHTEERRMMFRYGFFSRICSCSGLGLLFTSFVAPYWVTDYSHRINIGLWSPCMKNACKEIVNKPYMFRLIWILMTVCVIFGVLAVSLSFLTNTRGKSVKWPLITNLTTGLIALATMLLFGLIIHPKFNDQSSRHFVHFNWAYWVGCLATALFLMSGVLYFLISFNDMHTKSTKNQVKKDQPTDGQKKTEGMMNHHWLFIWGYRQNYYSGIWKICDMLNCRAITYISAQAKSAKVLLVLALFCGFISSSFLLITYRYFSRFAGYRYLVSAMGSFLTASLLFLGLTIYTIRIAVHKSRAVHIQFLSAFYVAWVSCLLFIISGFLGLMAHSHSPLQRMSLSDSETLSFSETLSTSNGEEEGKSQQTSVMTTDEKRPGLMKV